MRFTTAGLLAASAMGVSAFTDTFPFIVASTKELPKDVASNVLLNKAILTTDELASAAAPILSCPNVDHVLIWGERGLNAADFQHSKSFSTLKSTIESLPGILQIPEIRGELDIDALLKTLNECGHKTLKISNFLDNEFIAPFDGSAKTVFLVEKTGGILGLDDLSQGNADRSVRHERSRQLTLERDDNNLELALRKYKGKEYLLIYVGTPGVQWVSAATQGTPSDEYGNPVFSQDMLRQEIKRDIFLATMDDAPPKNGTARDTRPLFEKYQFFTPGLFMGLLVSLLLLSILFVGIRAISSLEVSYAAFEKEMGPSKKAQ